MSSPAWYHRRMAFPTPDADTLRRWKLGEQLSDLTIDNTNMPASRLYTGFVDDIEGDNLALFDTSPGSGDSQRWMPGVPGTFGERAMAFFRGTDPQTRDYLFGSADPEPASEISIWGLVYPYSFASPAQTVIHKERSPTVWADPTYSAQLFIGSTSGEWGTRITIAGVDKLILVGDGDTNNHLKMRLNQWNLIWMTHDGTTLRTGINGQVGPTLAAAGAIDWGTHGLWVLGGSRLIETAALDAMNAAIQDMWIEQVARPATYFFDAYMALVAEGGTGPPGITMTATAFDSTHVTVVFDTSMTTTGELVRIDNYQVRGQSGLADRVVSAVEVISATTIRLTVAEMKDAGTYQLLAANLVNADGDPVSVTGDEFTGIGVAPTVELLSPVDGATDVPRPTDILLGFSDTGSGVNRDTIQVTIEGDDAVVDGVIATAFKGPRSYVEIQSDGSIQINLDPVANFVFGEEVEIDAIAADNAGNALV